MLGDLYINKAVICKNIYSLGKEDVVHIYSGILLSH